MRFEDLFEYPGSAGYCTPKWDAIMSIPEFKAMETCPHSSKWHKEGGPMEHTKCVLNNMIWILSNGGFAYHKANVSSTNVKVLLLAALFHDIGKPACTIEKNGDYSAPMHGETGSGITRRLLFDEDIKIRERVVFMVRKHMTMHNIQLYKNPEKIKRTLVDFTKNWDMWDGDDVWSMMCILCLCDEMGSFRFDETMFEKYDRQMKLMELRNEYGVTAQYMSNYDVSFTDFSEPKFTDPINVYVMIGFAGSGKSTYIKNHLGDIPVVSRDIMRADMGFCKHGEKKILSKENENAVTVALEKKMCEYAEAGQDFVIDNMNLKLSYRLDYHTLLSPIRKIKWHYIYVEAPTIEDVVKRRESDFGESADKIVSGMVERLEFPYSWEYHTFKVIKQDN